MFFALIAYFSFSLLDAVQKTAIIYHSVFQLLFIKYCFVLILSIIESRRKKNYSFYKSGNIKLQILRSVLSIVESGCFVLSFRYLSLADTHSIASLTPVLVVALSAIILREHVSFKTWVAIFIGFIGVLVIMRPGLSIFDPKSLIPLAGAFFLSSYQIVTRKASETDSNETSLFYTRAPRSAAAQTRPQRHTLPYGAPASRSDDRGEVLVESLRVGLGSLRWLRQAHLPVLEDRRWHH